MRDLLELGLNEGGKPVTRKAPTEEEIRRFEAAHQVSLPDDYVNFLRVSNGGHPELNCFVPKGLAEDNIWSVDVFYHLGDDQSNYYNIWKVTRDWNTVLGEKAIPIAEDGGGNQIFLDFSTTPASVSLCIHDEDFGILTAAASFTEFIDMLALCPEAI